MSKIFTRKTSNSDHDHIMLNQPKGKTWVIFSTLHEYELVNIDSQLMPVWTPLKGKTLIFKDIHLLSTIGSFCGGGRINIVLLLYYSWSVSFILTYRSPVIRSPRIEQFVLCQCSG